MIKTSLEKQEIIDQINKGFIYIDMNINYDDRVVYKKFNGSIHDFARSLDVHFYPSTIFIGKDGEVKYHLVGYREKDKFSAVIEYVSTKSYEKIEFDTYLNEKEFNE